jgi:type VI secretion system protein ImpB
MASMTPGLKLKVENTLADDGSELAVDLQFKSMEDFSPINLVQQIDPLRKLYETREKLKELQSKVDRSDELQGVLEDVLRQTASLQQIASELGVGEAGAPSDSSDEPSAAQPQGDAE